MREQETNIKREAADAIISKAGQNISQFEPKWQLLTEYWYSSHDNHEGANWRFMLYFLSCERNKKYLKIH